MVWTTITNAQLAVGAPIRSVDLLALRDNVTAQANGDSGAPQQQTAGIADNAVTAAKVNKGNGLGTSGTQLVLACPGWNTVGSYAFAGSYTSVTASPGASVSGGNLQPGSALYNGGCRLEGSALSGTWRSMGNSRSDASGQPELTVFCRIS